VSTAPTDRPGLIEARPVRHPWRWVAIAGIAVLTAMMVNLIFTNTAFEWGFVFQAMFQSPVLRGLYIGLGTLAIASAMDHMVFETGLVGFGAQGSTIGVSRPGRDDDGSTPSCDPPAPA